METSETRDRRYEEANNAVNAAFADECLRPRVVFGHDDKGRITCNGEAYRFLSSGSTELGLERAAQFAAWLNEKVAAADPYFAERAEYAIDHPDEYPYLLTGPELSRAVAARIAGTNI